MTLNFSQRPVFPAHTSEDNMVPPLRIVNGGYAVEAILEEGGESFLKQRHAHGELHNEFVRGRETVDRGGSPDSAPEDVINLLPSDPFEMDIDIGTTCTTISGWFGDLEINYEDYTNNKISPQTIADLILNSAMRFQSYPNSFTPHYDKGSASDITTCPDVIGGEPHEAFVLALSYLRTKDLIMVERVCRSLCHTIRNDSLLWRNLHIDQPLNEKITDDILVKLTNRAEGNLQCLSLIKCSKITDDGLKRVLETNPKLTKLSVPGCTRLSIEGILNNLRAFKSSAEASGIKYIRTGGFYGITPDHFQQLKYILGIGCNVEKCEYNPRYYHRGNSYMPCDDDRALDVEVCPRCQNLRLVYDCPAEECARVKDEEGVDMCRACIICIPRCAECGRCVHNSEYEETFSLEYLCSECVKECQEMKVGVHG